MTNKIILYTLVSIGIICIIISLLVVNPQTIALSKAIGVIILLVSIKKIKRSTSINFHQK